MAEDMSKIVPDFLLGEDLVKCITEGSVQSGESKYYTIEQKPGKTYIYGINSASYVKDSIELTDEGIKQEAELWNVEAYDKYRKESKMWNMVFYVTAGLLLILTLASYLLLDFII